MRFTFLGVYPADMALDPLGIHRFLTVMGEQLGLQVEGRFFPEGGGVLVGFLLSMVHYRLARADGDPPR